MLVGGSATSTRFQPVPAFGLMTEQVIGSLSRAPIALSPSVPMRFASQELYEPAELPSGPSTEGTEGSARPAKWLQPVVARLVKLRDLPIDWDGHGAPPIDIADLASALSLLAAIMREETPAPNIVPISGGGLQLEWHRAGLYVEIVVGLGKEDGLYFLDKATGLEWEGPTREGFAEHDLAKRLIG